MTNNNFGPILYGILEAGTGLIKIVSDVTGRPLQQSMVGLHYLGRGIYQIYCAATGEDPQFDPVAFPQMVDPYAGHLQSAPVMHPQMAVPNYQQQPLTANYTPMQGYQLVGYIQNPDGTLVPVMVQNMPSQPLTQMQYPHTPMPPAQMGY